MYSKEKEIILHMLEVYKNTPCLWDKKHKDYSNRLSRTKGQEVLLEIYKQHEPHATIKSMMRKIQNMRTFYAKEFKKVKDSCAAAASPDDIYVPTLYYYDALTFLGESSEPCSTTRDSFKTEDESRESKPKKPRLDNSTIVKKYCINLEESCDSKPKKPRQDNFTIVKKCCINLVKKHGRSVTLFDDLAFRELIDLIPMTQSEKQTLTSQYIQTLLDDDQLADKTMDKTTDDFAADDEDDDSPPKAIKDEVEAVLCTCGKDTDESMSRHTMECPASSQQTYWNFFEVSLDSATCQICNKSITWTDITTLKEHLMDTHPSVDYVDDDDEFQKAPPSEDGSTNDFDMEEVYLDGTILETEQTASAAKRRRKRTKATLNITGPITRENIAASLQRFKSLDSFGQYVASLMKLIPKDKCIKLQIEIVERLLHEQAAAG